MTRSHSLSTAKKTVALISCFAGKECHLDALRRWGNISCDLELETKSNIRSTKMAEQLAKLYQRSIKDWLYNNIC